MLKLKRVYEYWCFESEKDKEDLKKHLGDDLYNDYMKIRDKISKDGNDYKDFQKLKKLPIEDVKSFFDNFQSETDKRKEAKKGAKKIYDDGDWLVYRITTYPAAQYYGKNTKWCITGRYPGHEGRGEEYFNDYIDDNNLDGGYYFYLNKKDPSDKYCVLQTQDGDIHSVWDATDTYRGDTVDKIKVELPTVPGVNLNKYNKRDIITASKEGNIPLIKSYLKDGNTPDVVDGRGKSLLYNAVYNSHRDLVTLLLKYHADPNFGEFSPINSAIYDDDIDTVKLLMNHGADINKSTEYSPSAVCTAIKNDRIEILDYLLDNSGDVDLKDPSTKYTPLFYSVVFGNVDTTKSLLEHGADPNIQIGETPLYRSLLSGKKDIMELLLKYHADPNIPNRFGNTSLVPAVEYGDLDTVKKLIKHGAKVDVKNNRGKSLLDYAKDKEIIDYLKSLGLEE